MKGLPEQMSSIIWMASYPKSGNTWVRAFVQNLLDATDRPADINALDKYFANESKPNWYQPLVSEELADLSIEQICELRPTVQRNIATSRAGSIFVKTHNLLGDFNGRPLHEMSVTAGAIYIVRNPLDVVLSLADHFGLSIDDAIEFMNSDTTGTPTDEANVSSVLSSWSKHVRSWTADSESTCVLRYEDLLAKPEKAFGPLVKFLGLNRDRARLKLAIKFSSFGELRKQEAQQGFIERSPNSQRFFRSGRQNLWRTKLGREQITRITDAHGDEMKRFKYLPPGY
jgi:hypothetical protein